MAIDLVKKHATRIANGNARVQPGQPLELNEAAAVNDGIAQGDLIIKVIEDIPADYKKSAIRQQLVPGNTVGSRHALQDISTVDGFWLPRGWSPDADHDGLLGPIFRCKETTTITHPTHGHVIIAAGHLIQTTYQRNLDLITRQERRARD